ncbi:MAG: D-alanine--D-alanine ligase [Anaerotruncus sp.]|nr:D-alanine--D-alanine ligase [Anaerotruncus sp.]
MKKKTVAVLFGSISSEYEVSLLSAASVLRNIPRASYDVVMLGITKDGRWLEYTGEIDLIEQDQWQQSGCTTPAILSPDRSVGGIQRFTPNGVETVKIDLVFPVLHGEHGEDGTMQGLLELTGIPYVGCGVLASSTCMDKEITHILLEQAGIATAAYEVVTQPMLEQFAQLEQRLATKLGYPVFVKPANTGSSVGVSKVRSADALRDALETAFRYDRKVLAEQAMVGAEVECAVLGNYEDCIASVVGEIVPHHEFYDYAGKYLDNSSDLYIPARIANEVSEQVRTTACRAFAVMGCTGLARVDFFVLQDGSIRINEINTIPGFTSISMYPKLFDTAGIPYDQLIDRLLQLAQKRH